MASVYRTDDLTEAEQVAAARTPEQQAEFEAGQAEARAKQGDPSAAERVARERMTRAGSQRGSLTGGGYGSIKRGAGGSN